jgi:hypothetical protein
MIDSDIARPRSSSKGSWREREKPDAVSEGDAIKVAWRSGASAILKTEQGELAIELAERMGNFKVISS